MAYGFIDPLDYGASWEVARFPESQHVAWNKEFGLYLEDAYSTNSLVHQL